ncbi:ABC transporter ATP-binding protein [Bacillus sp. Marseille-Q3570]|uniref:ABC transporter ATP-binding protein n=1 Tax=Bacillus sp. Marseille-Q3570 TaxID=2963522 RepID=UPI0021B7C455|nr:ABC transporter ATP-binding protein [Bacillus sp. Marseille-Q3570]
MIEVHGLSFTYPGKRERAIKNLNFSIPKGEIFGFLGPSGAGKSTTQNVLIGILKDYDGSVRLFGNELHYTDNQLYNSIGVAFERPNFYSKFTASENLAYFSRLYDKPVKEPDKLLARLGLQDVHHTRVSHFSKGMKMRLNLCRALLHEPEILFLDEPTAGLDPVNTKVVKELLLEQKRAGKTIIISTHNMHIAEEICDRVAFIVDGELKLIDSPERLKLQNNKILSIRYQEDDQVRKLEFPLKGLEQNERFLDLLKRDLILSMHTAEHSLENIFIKVTGRQLQ